MMKVFLLNLILLSFIFNAYTQESEQTEDQKMFEQMLDVYYDDLYDSALNLCYQFLEKFPHSALYPRAKFNIGYISFEQADIEQAVKEFHDILNANYDEYEGYGGIMEEYTLYKHRSSKYLALIYLDQGEYEEAIKYIRMFDKKYPYKHFCGNELYMNEMFVAHSYSRYYLGVGKYKKALKFLIPHFFYSGLAPNNHIIELIEEILKKQYSVVEIEQILETAKSSLLINKKGEGFIDFLGSKIEVSTYSLFSIRNIEFEANLELSHEEQLRKVVDSHPLFEKYN